MRRNRHGGRGRLHSTYVANGQQTATNRFGKRPAGSHGGETCFLAEPLAETLAEPLAETPAEPLVAVTCERSFDVTSRGDA